MNKETFHFCKKSTIWIYGYGFLGRPLFKRMVKAGYAVKGFIDCNADILCDTCPYPMIHPSQLECINQDDIIIISFQNIKEQEKVAYDLSCKNYTHLIYLYRKTELFPQTFDLYNSLVYGDFAGEFDFPITRLDTVEDRVYYRTYNNFVITDMPVQLLFSAVLQSPIELGDNYVKADWKYPVVSMYEYNAFFKMALHGTYEEVYLERYIKRLQRGRSTEEFLCNRTELCAMLQKEFCEGGLSFFRNAPSHVVFDIERGRFCLEDGHHRACFLVNLGQNYIPVRIAKQEYDNWLNNSVADVLLSYFNEEFIDEIYTPVLHPSFLKMKTFTENLGYLNASAIYSYFARYDISGYTVIDLNANLSYYSRVFARIGVKDIISVEQRAKLRKAAGLINTLEHCKKIKLFEDIPDDAGDILLWLNDMVYNFDGSNKKMETEVIHFLDKHCKHYLLIKTSYAERLRQLIKENTRFKLSTRLNCVLENGTKTEVLLFGKDK